jgi:riboflavin biosynthesis pyrimidine reductase
VTEDELAEVAAQLVGRVREDDPAANARWLDAVCPAPADRYALLFVLAAAVPVDRPWRQLTKWAHSLAPVEINAESLPPEVDEVALRRALHGEVVQVPTVHKRAMVAILTRHGLSARVIAERLDLTERQVQRHREVWRATRELPGAADSVRTGGPSYPRTTVTA